MSKTQKEKSHVDQLLKEYNTLRLEQKNKILHEFSEQDWKDFEAYARTIPGAWGRDLIKSGVLNRQSKKLDHWVDIFIGSKRLPKFEEGFIEWAYNKHGVTLQEDHENQGQFRIISMQSNLFG